MESVVSELALAVYGFKPKERRIERAGIHWELREVRHRLTLGYCTLPVYKDPNAPAQYVEAPTGNPRQKTVLILPPPDARVDMFDPDDEAYEKYLMALDPQETKSQDHYKVLGLKNLRYDATMDEIRLAYRVKVLKYHPDKKMHSGFSADGDEFFTCIIKAYEQLGMSEAKRRAFDSVDPYFEDVMPAEKDVDGANFFKILRPVFEQNARFSVVQPVPALGDENTPREKVEEFYAFWFNFNSWREFSYWDKIGKDTGEARWERRAIEKANKTEREKFRKEYLKKVSTLVAMAQSKDPRIAMFKKQDDEEKERLKEEKARLRREKQEAEEQEKRKLQDEMHKLEEEEKARQKEAKESEKRQIEATKAARKSAQKRFEKLCSAHNYWASNDREKLQEMERADRLNFLLTTEEINKLCDKLDGIHIESKQVIEMLASIEASKKTSAETGRKATKPTSAKEDVVLWTDEELHLLTKAANLYPAGTIDRWIVIADYVNEHRKDNSTPKKNEKQVIRQTKLVQIGAAKPTAAAQNKLGVQILMDDEPWTNKEQKQLEEGLKKYPATDPERWTKIAAEVSGRSKKACIKRYKELVDLVKKQRK